MRFNTYISLALAVVPSSFAFSGSTPLLAWSSERSLPSVSHIRDQAEAIKALLGDTSICDYDAIIVAHQPGLHASQLRSLPPSSPLSALLKSAPYSVHVPYLQSSDSSLTSISENIADQCGSRFLDISLDQGGVPIESSEHYVVRLSLPEAYGSEISERASQISREITRLTTLAPRHLVILTGAGSSSLTKRQFEDDWDESIPPSFAPNTVSSAPTEVSPEGGILKRYQLLTPALITSILVAFGLLLPILLTGLNALASIQASIRMDGLKGAPTLEKKNQ